MSNQTIRKTRARTAERDRARRRATRHDTLTRALPFVIGAAVILFIGIAAFVATNQPTPTIQGTVGPRLSIDQEKIDFGTLVFDKTVRAVFNVKNIGDGTLKLDVPKAATLVEGC